MKKFWLFLSLIICNSLLTWCFERNLINDTISDDIDIVNESGVVETLTLQNLKTSCEELVPDSQWITRINEKLYDNTYFFKWIIKSEGYHSGYTIECNVDLQWVVREATIYLRETGDLTIIDEENLPDVNEVLSHMNIKYQDMHRALIYYKNDTSDYYLLPWNWELNELSGYKIFINDRSRKYDELNVSKKEKDKATFFCYFCDDIIHEILDWQPWEDINNLFLDWWNFAVDKNDLPWYAMLTDIWIQAFDWIVWYTEWYLVLFPYKFSVDTKTFVDTDSDRRYKFQNWWLQYHHYIWNDKDYVYYWDDYDWIYLNRVKKENDFKVLEKDNEWVYIYDKESWLEYANDFDYNVLNDYELNTTDNIIYSIFKQDWNMVYITSSMGWEYNYWIWKFPVDGQSLKITKISNPEPLSEYDTTTFTLWDKNYYYQIIENENWYRIFQRIKK